MAVVNYSYARQNLAKLMDEVEQDCAPVFITRQRKRGGAVLVSLDEARTACREHGPFDLVLANLIAADADVSRPQGLAISE